MEVVRCSQGEVGEELEVARAVGAELEVARWYWFSICGVVGLAFQGGQVGCLDCAREAELGEFFFDVLG